MQMKPLARPYRAIVGASWRIVVLLTVLSTLLSGCAPIE